MSWFQSIVAFFQIIKQLLEILSKAQKYVNDKKAEAKAQGIAELKEAKTDEERLAALKKITKNS